MSTYLSIDLSTYLAINRLLNCPTLLANFSANI